MKTKFFEFADIFHTRYKTIVTYLQHPLIFLIRLYWGYDFFQTGMGKLNNLERTTDFFASLNIPFPAFNAIFVGNLEMIGGLLLIAGLGARYITIPLIGTLTVAYLTDDREALMKFFSEPEKFVTATPFPHLLASLIILTFGAGAFSLDGIIRYFRQKKN